MSDAAGNGVAVHPRLDQSKTAAELCMEGSPREDPTRVSRRVDGRRDSLNAYAILEIAVKGREIEKEEASVCGVRSGYD